MMGEFLSGSRASLIWLFCLLVSVAPGALAQESSESDRALAEQIRIQSVIDTFADTLDATLNDQDYIGRVSSFTQQLRENEGVGEIVAAYIDEIFSGMQIKKMRDIIGTPLYDVVTYRILILANSTDELSTKEYLKFHEEILNDNTIYRFADDADFNYNLSFFPIIRDLKEGNEVLESKYLKVLRNIILAPTSGKEKFISMYKEELFESDTDIYLKEIMSLHDQLDFELCDIKSSKYDCIDNISSSSEYFKNINDDKYLVNYMCAPKILFDNHMYTFRICEQ